MDITLVVLAAGIGSRYGAGVKQLEKVGPTGEIIMDYSIHDAIQAGFNKVVFIIRHEIYDDFMEVIGSRLERRFRHMDVKWEYAFQELTDSPACRTKPWGTGHAILSCKRYLTGPFAVINADDYYGKHAFTAAYKFLSSRRPGEEGKYGMVGFVLKNTLSDVGGVTRGVCATDQDGALVGITETHHIVKTPDGAAVQEGDTLRPLDPESLVSMNMWLLTPDFVRALEEGFEPFKARMKDPAKDEYLLPEIVDRMLHSGKATVQVIRTGDSWFGVTYQEDKPLVVQAFRGLIDAGVYKADLFSDM